MVTTSPMGRSDRHTIISSKLIIVFNSLTLTLSRRPNGLWAGRRFRVQSHVLMWAKVVMIFDK